MLLVLLLLPMLILTLRTLGLLPGPLLWLMMSLLCTCAAVPVQHCIVDAVLRIMKITVPSLVYASALQAAGTERAIPQHYADVGCCCRCHRCTALMWSPC